MNETDWYIYVALVKSKPSKKDLSGGRTGRKNWEGRETMPKYEAKRHYVVTEVCTIEAENANQAKIIAMNWDGHWKEYEDEYDDEITVYEVSDEWQLSDAKNTLQFQFNLNEDG